MKNDTTTPRIVEVATDIAAAQARCRAIHNRCMTLQQELEKLLAEKAQLVDQRLALAREMDKLTA